MRFDTDIKAPEDWDRKDKDGNPIEFDPYVSIHTHSYFSLLDGMSSPKQIVDKTYELGSMSSCITDHGVMLSLVDHFNYAKVKGQKAIAGFEAYVVGDHSMKSNETTTDNDNSRQHLLLLAKNNNGYKKISYWCSRGCTDGFYYRPRIDDNIMLETGGEDIIATSACIGGRIPKLIARGEIQKAEDAARFYRDFFEEFYLEIQPTMEPIQSEINMQLIKIGDKLNIPIVATSDSHYTNRKDSITHDILLAMQSNKTLDDPNRWRFPGDTFFIAGRAEMEELFRWGDHDKIPKDIIKMSLDNTVRIARNCNFELELGKHYLPNIGIPMDNTNFIKWHEKVGGDINANYLKYLCIKSLKGKGLTSSQYKARLEHELKVINEMGFNDYFLIYYDIMEFCRNNDIPYGPGRGCFSSDNMVNLVNGESKSISEVRLNDVVIGHDEKPNKVLLTYEYDCNEKLINIETENGKKINCTKDHKVYAIKKEDFEKGIRQPKWYAMDELKEDDYLAELE